MIQVSDDENELWDIYDKDRVKTGKTHRRGDPMESDEYHMVVHVCIFNDKNQLLIQQRSPQKAGWPGMWDITVGGSACVGETSQMAAEREVLEEIGLSFDLSNIRPHFTINFDCGFDDYYLIEKDVKLPELTLQEEEVKQVKWVKKEEVLRLMEAGEMVPYYFLESLFEIRSQYGSHFKI